MKKVLMELRPCFDGYAGIPQDTRVTYGLLSEMEGVELGGHLLDRGLGALGFKWSNYKDTLQEVSQQSGYLAALDETENNNVSRSLLSRFSNKALALRTGASYIENILGKGRGLHDIDSSLFSDFLWRKLFEKTLSIESMKPVMNTRFLAGSGSYSFYNRVMAAGLPPMSIDTKDWDVYISQTPLPAKVHSNTQLIVRYHDAVPILFPHTIKDGAYHQKFITRSLQLASEGAQFACNSEATRQQLISIAPHVESRTSVVHCSVPDVFYEDRGDVSEIIRKRLRLDHLLSMSSSTQDNFEALKELEDNYFICVGTMEPRKNYTTVLDAWDRFRTETGRDIKLVIVGGAGWNSDALLDQMKRYGRDGKLFVLNGVPTYELRRLYSSALATIVASYSEGFSYSGVESMRCNTPVIASDIDVHREVYGDYPLYFNPYSAQELSEQMEELLGSSRDSILGVLSSAREFSQRYSEKFLADKWQSILGCKNIKRELSR